MTKTLIVVVAAGIGVACGSSDVARNADPRQPPAELIALIAAAKLEGTISAWCRAEFREGEPGGFAIAMTSGPGGRYVAIDADGRTNDLASFTSQPDLSCYSRREADGLNASIGQSDTIHGQVTPQWNTDVVCGFVVDTTAECWQYSPADRRFANVGGWTT